MPMKIVVVGTRWSKPHRLTHGIHGHDPSAPLPRDDCTLGYIKRIFSYKSTAVLDVQERDMDIVLWVIRNEQKYIDVAEAAVINADALVICVGGGHEGNRRIQRRQLQFAKRFHNLSAGQNVPVVAVVSTVSKSNQVYGMRWGETDPFAQALHAIWPNAWRIVQLPTPTRPRMSSATRDALALLYSSESSDQIDRFFIALFDEVAVTCGVGDELIPARPGERANEAAVLHSNLQRYPHNRWGGVSVPRGTVSDIKCCCLQS